MFTRKRKATVSLGIWTVLLCIEPRNVANCPAEFGKIFCGKLWP